VLLSLPQVSSGRLLRAWPAHYKAVTAISFTDDDSLLVTASEDTVVNVWSLMTVLDAFNEDPAPPVPMFAWSEHTLPVQVGPHTTRSTTRCVVLCQAGSCWESPLRFDSGLSHADTD
jgi:WD40 repeat protein